MRTIRFFSVFLLQFLPITLGKLVKHDLTLSWEVGAPNGQPRELIKVNGQFPGPSLVWDEDDDVEVWVHNRMDFNSSIHWHGLQMQGTPWSDGAPGVTQKPIEVGETFIYRFKAYPAGIHWYHSHSRVTLLDGLYGPILIRPKPESPKPWHLISSDPEEIQKMDRAANEPKLLTVSDWSSFKSWEYMAAQEASDLSIFCVDSILINGKGSVYCPGQDFLVNHTSTYMKYAFYPSQVNDKGCFPFMLSTQGKYLWGGRPEAVPLHLHKGCVPSEGQREIIEVDPEQEWISLNVVMAATFKTTVFSIDQHKIWVYAVDGGFIEPQLVDTFHMYAGERYSILVKLDQKPRDYTIRVPDNGLTQVLNAVATLRYQGSTDHSETQGLVSYGGLSETPVVTMDRENLPPYPPHAPAAQASDMHVMNTQRWYAPWKYTMSKGAVDTGGIWGEDRGAYTPLLHNPEHELAHNESLIIRTKNGSWVDLVVQVGSHPKQPQEFPHAMHKHAQKMWKIGGSFGIWNYASVDEAIAAQPEAFNLVNPPYRDTFVTKFEGSAWIVLRYQVTNPGPWMFHCHIESHLGAGMGVAILDGVEAWPEVPPEYGPDLKGFRPEDGLPHTVAWEMQHHPEHFIESGSEGEELPVTCSTTKPFSNEGGNWNKLLKKVIGFLQTLFVESEGNTSRS
ncbi:conidial pigment biosynthesis oxidase Arb2/brown2 [Clohesyomyces aquaticus]|uniref:Conidial pigment biosynthesis oxidase Arb2/brown2 n=1 Tax=Clohesyomyces aquaticus TaxID=1231657 RepID=A0A1Y1ZKY2_9PLEO|nr:conidial pigment biosynthesis oxidase Arb2/brown2 [Clohesyomyces aquaticus]